MQFPNAAAGSRKIYVGEILTLIAAICTGVSLMMVYFAAASVSSAGNILDDAGSTAEEIGAAIGGAATSTLVTAGIGGLLVIAGGIVALIGLILYMVGAGQAGNDEPAFKTVLYIMIAVIVLNVVGSFFTANSLVVSAIVRAVSSLLSLYATFLTMEGFRRLAEQLGNNEVAERAISGFKTIACLIIVQVVLNIVSSFISGTVGGILTLVGLVISLVWYILFIGFLGKSKAMLNS